MDWLRNMHDWMISKKRYWGLALPIWVCEECDYYEVIGSEIELNERAVEGWETFEGHTPHRPFVDAVKIECPNCHGLMSRIPDVGNPWLDAGIVPFSTLRYRFDRDYWQDWYPADWISESFPGQFRNWFYSLLAMATVIDQSPPFKEVFTYGTLLAEDGRPMHKSWGNAIEFNEAADQMGVDVMRWLFCAHKPESDLLFGYQRGDEVRRRFLIPFWNVYSFFVTYANLDGWVPGRGDFQPEKPEGEAPESENLLDRWVIGRLNQVVRDVTGDLEAEDLVSATVTAEAFLDDLTNWYVRRSRRRFWKSEHDEDKNAAYATLYHVLVKFAKLLAPFVPFVTEAMYQNLVRSCYPEAYESIHQCDWTEANLAVVDQKLLDQMELAREISSLGLSARNSAGIKVRQPLSKVLAYVPGKRSLSNELVEIVTDELNVKELEYVAEASQLVNYQVMPDNKLLGPRFGAMFPKVRAVLSAADQEQVANTVQSGEPVMLQIDGQPVTLAPEEILVQTQPAQGLAVAADKFATVALDTKVTPELRAEGLAREIVRRVQAMRKEADFDIADRITTYYQSNGDLNEVFQAWSDYIKSETLSMQLVSAEPPEGAYTETQKVDGQLVTLAVEKVGRL
jgi:isoleucyl-tRNA synthetase